MSSIYAYAKVNLLLAVRYPPAGGFHSLQSVFQTVDLADELDFSRVPRGEFAFFREGGAGGAAGEGPDGEAGAGCGRGGESPVAAPARPLAFTAAGSAVVLECEPDVGQPCKGNLVFRALDAMERTCGQALVGCGEALHVQVKKSIPAGGGLGGGSSDAAAAISWYAAEYGFDPLGREALGVAAALGSDVACFLYGGATLMSGKGEHLERRLPACPLPLVLMGDAQGNSTPAVYAAFDADPQPAPDAASLVSALEHARAAGLGGAAGAGSMSAVRAEHAAFVQATPARAASPSASAGECAAAQIPPAREGVEPAAAQAIARACANNLQEAAFACNPRLRGRVERAQADPDVLAALVTGSGSTSFAICADDAAAQRFAARAAAFSSWMRVVHPIAAQ